MTFNTASRTFSVSIPDTLRSWPWKRTINPHYSVCKEESSKWCESFKAFSPSAQEAFDKCDFSLLGCLTYPLLDKDGCRLACDLINLFFIIDDHTDLADVETARAQADIIMHAIRNPHIPRPEDEWIVGKITQQFWLDAMKSATASSQRHFIETFQLYMDAVVQQAVDRSRSYIRDIDNYFSIRRNTIGTRPAFAICGLYMNLPNTVLDHPVIVKMSVISTDMIIITNDLCSYKVEWERGDDGHNLVTVVMHQLGIDHQGAINYVSDLHEKLATQFLDEWKMIPNFGGALDLDVQTYCYGLANWVRGNDSWCFESERYFGKNGRHVQETRQLILIECSSSKSGSQL